MSTISHDFERFGISSIDASIGIVRERQLDIDGNFSAKAI